MGSRTTTLTGVASLFFLWVTASMTATGKSAEEAQARERLAQKLLRLSQSLDMKERSFLESQGGGKDYNSNDGNSFTSNTTYHSYTWSYCLRWLGGRVCRRWLDPYVALHGFTDDQSPLEAAAAKNWAAYKKDGEDGKGGQYAMWNVATKDGKGVLDIDGKLDQARLSQFELIPDVRRRMENVGDQTAVRQISLTYDDSTGKGANTMPNMESLRMMAERWTKMYRNRMVTNLGDLRAMDRNVEFALGEDKASCRDYVNALQREMEETRTEERVQPQALLDAETKARSLQERYNNCVALRTASVQTINPVIRNGAVTQGALDDEQLDKALSRLAIATVDNVGVDPRSLSVPGYTKLTETQVSNELVDYQSGGLSSRRIRMTNAQQLQSYNDNLEQAAVGMQEVSARSGGYIVDNSERIRQFKIQPGTMNMVQLNGLTAEMRGELRDTSFPRTSPQPQADEPAVALEQRPSDLTVSRTP